MIILSIAPVVTGTAAPAPSILPSIATRGDQDTALIWELDADDPWLSDSLGPDMPDIPPTTIVGHDSIAVLDRRGRAIRVEATSAHRDNYRSTPDGATIAVLGPASEHSTARLQYEDSTGRVLWQHSGDFHDFEMSADGQVTLLVGDHAIDPAGNARPCVSVLDASGRYKVLEYGAEVMKAQMSPNGSDIAVLAGTASHWEGEHALSQIARDLEILRLTPDSVLSRFPVGIGDGTFRAYPDGNVAVWLNGRLARGDTLPECIYRVYDNSDAVMFERRWPCDCCGSVSDSEQVSFSDQGYVLEIHSNRDVAAQVLKAYRFDPAERALRLVIRTELSGYLRDFDVSPSGQAFAYVASGRVHVGYMDQRQPVDMDVYSGSGPFDSCRFLDDRHLFVRFGRMAYLLRVGG